MSSVYSTHAEDVQELRIARLLGDEKGRASILRRAKRLRNKMAKAIKVRKRIDPTEREIQMMDCVIALAKGGHFMWSR